MRALAVVPPGLVTSAVIHMPLNYPGRASQQILISTIMVAILTDIFEALSYPSDSSSRTR